MKEGICRSFVIVCALVAFVTPSGIISGQVHIVRGIMQILTAVLLMVAFHRQAEKMPLTGGVEVKKAKKKAVK